MLGTLGHLHVVRTQFVKRGLQVQHGGGHFHGQCRRWGLTRTGHRFGGLRQRIGQRCAARMQAAQGVTHQAELVQRGFEFVAVTTCQCRPGFGGGGHTFAGLGQNGGVVTAKPAHFVVHRAEAVQPVGLAHRGQDRRLVGSGRLRTEEQHVLPQAL